MYRSDSSFDFSYRTYCWLYYKYNRDYNGEVMTGFWLIVAGIVGHIICDVVIIVGVLILKHYTGG